MQQEINSENVKWNLSTKGTVGWGYPTGYTQLKWYTDYWYEWDGRSVCGNEADLNNGTKQNSFVGLDINLTDEVDSSVDWMTTELVLYAI